MIAVLAEPARHTVDFGLREWSKTPFLSAARPLRNCLTMMVSEADGETVAGELMPSSYQLYSYMGDGYSYHAVLYSTQTVNHCIHVVHILLAGCAGDFVVLVGAETRKIYAEGVLLMCKCLAS
jgi:hypothetical protein